MSRADDLETDIRRMMGAEAQPSQAAEIVNTWLAEMSRADPALAAQIREQFNFSPDDEVVNLADSANANYDYSHSLPAISLDAGTHDRVHALARERHETIHATTRHLIRSGLLAHAHATKGK